MAVLCCSTAVLPGVRDGLDVIRWLDPVRVLRRLGARGHPDRWH